MTMTNDELTQLVLNHEHRINALEGTEQPVEPPAPVPPVNPHVPPSEADIIDIDMTRAYHIDIPIDAGETQVFRFEFAGGLPGINSYTQFTAVQLYSTDGCFKMAIPEYGHGNKKCRYEISNGVGTDDTHTSWVVPVNREIYLYVKNTGGDTTLRLKCNGENPY